jgi:hypothetical protein
MPGISDTSLSPRALPNLAVLDQGDGAPRRRSRPLRHALRACGVGAGPYGRADRTAHRTKTPPQIPHSAVVRPAPPHSRRPTLFVRPTGA